MDLRRMACSVASSYGDKGALILSVSDEGVRIGTEGLTPDELRQALCLAIHYSYELEPQS